ncbi:MAG: bifunctional (p)ppGpp synthetase/guanosine-3',5'-bis(diphosphate) 3'-pyrophosphohydrolase [Bacteroidetes bacterium]|jgi:guanosine-3',5'-bis(diphosphate) 3'-pyrophosphohydrolase|nr:bifunctional (p)ppGpp synthetase/guanosine-3',5'-bis(diphosphate) 3'-pyrophosphohydrolase [Bacteroidota bacterium]MBP9119619.1 bifunctional (p)ppGpp synthetase/guanosine-3',5'-bis(diphosphate) 3'-pyrophosphohydrolase [Ignavibacterium sp.]
MLPQTLYQTAIKFATLKHVAINQKVPGTDLPYVVHLSNVAMEVMMANANTENFNVALAIQAALLHDTIEDTDTTFSEVEENFGLDVANAVMALTKNESLPKEEQMMDSLQRIKKMPHEVWAVKLADRITNLQAPPSHWDNAKKKKYRAEAQIILDELASGNVFLADRLQMLIEDYRKYISND